MITKKMLLTDVLDKYPDTADVMQRYGLKCFGCNSNTLESIEEGALEHGMDDEKMEKMLTEMNQMIEKEPEKKEELKIINNNPIANASVTLTPKAASVIKKLLESQNKSKYGLRFGIARGGCSGYQYLMDFEENPKKEDTVLEREGVKIFIDGKSLEKLNGCSIDYFESLQNSGFKIENPNAEHNCGCGKSFG